MRALALATVLLTALAVLSPALGHKAGSELHRLHGLKVITLSASDQAGTTVRVDQPTVASDATPVVTLARQPVDDAAAEAGRAAVEVETADPRGPPGAR